MGDLQLTLLVISICGGTGAILDRWLLDRLKPRLHHWLLERWNQLDETSIPDLPRLMVQWTLTVWQKVFPWRLFPWQSLGICFVLSWVLTSIATLIAGMLDGGYSSPRMLPWFTLYLVNFPFDFLTLAITIRLLHLIQRASTLKVLALIVFDVLLALSLAALGLVAMLQTGDFELNPARLTEAKANMASDPELERLLELNEKRRLGEVPSSAIEAYFSSAPAILADAARGKRHILYRPHPTDWPIVQVRWAAILASITTLVPTVAYISFLVFMITAKLALQAIRASTMYYLEHATQKDPEREPKEFMPFTLIGISLGFAGTMLKKLIEEMLK